jgi:5-methyltetrahydropteroyltriglutamate--homocysteine methyltransferase
VTDVVERQLEAGITIVGDGEFKAMTSAVDYGAWWSYSFQRVGGLSLTGEDPFNRTPVRSEPGHVRLTTFPDRRDWTRFREAYTDPESGISTGKTATAFPSTTGALKYVGHDAIASDIAHLKEALGRTGAEVGFLTALSPGSGARIPNRYYGSEEEHVWAWADVLREEYRAIVESGLTDQVNPEPSVGGEGGPVTHAYKPEL